MLFFCVLTYSALFLPANVASWQEPQGRYSSHRSRFGWQHKHKGLHKHETLNAIPSDESSKENVLSEKHQQPENYTVCRTKQCFKMAGEFWQNINFSVNPCDDFYEYACGRWEELHPLPPTESNWGPMAVIQDVVEHRVRDLLETDDNDEVMAVRLVKKYYQSCMDVDSLEKRGTRPLEAMLIRTGGWPMVMEEHEWNPIQFTWHQVENYYVRLYGQFALFNVKIEPNFSEGIYMLKLMKPLLPFGIPENDFDRESLYSENKYADYITKVAFDFAKSRGVTIPEERIRQDVADIINFEKRLYETVSLAADTEKVMTVTELQQLYDEGGHGGRSDNDDFKEIYWDSKLSVIFEEGGSAVSDDDNITLKNERYFKYLGAILDDTPERTIVNYIQWYYLSQMLPHTTEYMRNFEFEVTRKMYGIQEKQPRWKECISYIKLNHAITYMYIKKHYKEKMTEDTEEMINEMRGVMKKKIAMADWLNDETRDAMIAKVDRMKSYIGYPEWYDNSTRMAELYSGMAIGRQWLDNIISYKKYYLKSQLRQIVGYDENYDFEKDEEGWSLDPMTVNAEYSVEENRLTVPAADYYPPAYSKDTVHSMNYGAIGMIIAHEISHGFDPEGHKVDKDGINLEWAENIEKKYTQKQKCFIKQFNEFNKEEMKAKRFAGHGKTKLSENVADSMGEETSLLALHELEKDFGEPRLPGFENYSSSQMFFISMANLWCEISTLEYDFLMAGDEHSKSKYRVNAPAQNSELFAKAFNCPLGSRMNPKTKCKIW